MTPVPHQLFVRYLVTKGCSTLGEVNEALAEQNLPAIEASLFAAEQELVLSQVPLGIIKQIKSKTFGIDFAPAMRVLAVWDMWRSDKRILGWETDDYRGVVKLATDLNQDLALRLTINSLLIKQVSHRDISQTINLRYAAMLREEHLDFYQRFFFNPQIMTRASWKKYLKVCESRERSGYLTALTSPLEDVKAKLEIPAKHSTSEVLQMLLSKSVQNARESFTDRTPSGRLEAMKWVDTVLKLTDKFEKFRAGDQADLANSLQMEFDFVEVDFPSAGSESVHELEEKTKAAKDVKEAEAKALADLTR